MPAYALNLYVFAYSGPLNDVRESKLSCDAVRTGRDLLALLLRAFKNSVEINRKRSAVSVILGNLKKEFII
jgi:hypothetical protein